MGYKKRRESLKEILNDTPIKGSELAGVLGVTRQVIVKDIAILKAEGVEIISTPKGYVLGRRKGIRKVVAVNHSIEETASELRIIIKYGGSIEDVSIEHPIYGELTGKLMIKSVYDMEVFLKKAKKYNAPILSEMAGGIHLHTIFTETQEEMDKIICDLEKSGYLITI